MATRGTMDRRTFLGAAGVVAAAGSCAVVAPVQAPQRSSRSPALSRQEMSRYLADVDSTMERLRKTSMLHRLTRADDRCPKLAARTAAGEELLASSLRSLTMTAAVLDVPAANRSHPGLRDRLQRALPEMDASIFGITSMLASTSEADRAAMNRYLREDPKAGPRICEEFDLAARRVGLPLAPRGLCPAALGVSGGRGRRDRDSRPR